MEVLTLVTGPSDGDHDPDSDGLTALLSRLKLAHRQAANPPTGRSAPTAGCPPRPSAASSTPRNPPRWENLERVLKALRIDPEADPTRRELWFNAENDAKPITVVELVDGMVVPGRRSCTGCGTWIADDETHDRHHQHIDELTLCSSVTCAGRSTT
jgi:hypothetical protein